MPRTDVIDQSNNNSTLAPLDGLVGYAHKVSEGHTFFDGYARERLGAAVAAGVRYVCAYHVLRATGSSGTEQAQWFLSCCQKAGFDITARGSIVMNDWEGWSDGFASVEYAHEFADVVNAAAGRECVIHYGGLPNPGFFSFDHVWLADYRTLAPILSPLFPQAAVWQWGDQAAGGGDTNQIVDQDWLDHLAGYTVPPLPPPPDPMKEFDMPALFQCTDAIHWPGSPTLAAGDYPPNNGIVFAVTNSGAVRHVTYDEFHVYLGLKAPVAVVAGAQLRGLLTSFGVFKA